MKRIAFATVMSAALLTAGITASGQEVTVGWHDDSATVEVSSDNERFSRSSFTLGSSTLSYREASIGHNASEKPALVLYLHGGSSRGSDNAAQLKEKAVGDIYGYLLSRGIAATLIVPQCPAGGGWTGQLRKVVCELLKSYVKAGAADADRIYVMGGSMGGTGTWCQVANFPDFYAAAMPVAGNPTGMNSGNAAKTPVLTVMGTADNIMSISAVEDFRQEVLSAGGCIRLDIEEGWTHQNTCEQSYTAGRLDWLFSQTRGDAAGLASTFGEAGDGAFYDLKGCRTDRPMRGIYIRNGKKVVFR